MTTRANAGDPVAAHLTQEIDATRRRTRNYLIRSGILLALALALLVAILVALPSRIAHPGWIAELAEREAGAVLPDLVEQSKQRLIASAPRLTEQVRREILRAVPQVGDEIAADSARHSARAVADAAERLDEILGAAIAGDTPQLDEIVAAEGAIGRSRLQALGRELHVALAASYRPDVAGDEDQFPDTADVLEAIARKARVVAGDDPLTPEEYLLRQIVEHAVAFLLDLEPADADEDD
jgi:hypothetical protein